MGKKGVTVWLFSSLTFISLLHLIDSASAFLFNTPSRLLGLYPVIGQKLQESLTTQSYLWVSGISTFILWGITCAIVFENPVEVFLNKILSDAKKQSAVETQVLEGKSEILDAMYETIESSNDTVSHIKDIVYNVRTEVKEIKPLTENVEKVKSELASLKREVKRLEEKVQYPTICLSCGKPLLPEFKMCPYCGEKVQSTPEKIISLKDYR